MRSGVESRCLDVVAASNERAKRERWATLIRIAAETVSQDRWATLIRIAAETVSQDRWTQKQLASALGITPRTLQNYFRRGKEWVCVFCKMLVDVIDQIEAKKHEKRMREIRAIPAPDYRSMPTWKILRMLERMAPDTWGRKKPFEN